MRLMYTIYAFLLHDIFSLLLVNYYGILVYTDPSGSTVEWISSVSTMDRLLSPSPVASPHRTGPERAGAKEPRHLSFHHLSPFPFSAPHHLFSSIRLRVLGYFNLPLTPLMTVFLVICAHHLSPLLILAFIFP